MAVNTSHPIGSKVRWAILPEETLNEQITGAAPVNDTGTYVDLPEGRAYLPPNSYIEWATNSAGLDTFNDDVTFFWYGRIDIPASLGTIGSFFHGDGWSADIGQYDTSIISFELKTRYYGSGPNN